MATMIAPERHKSQGGEKEGYVQPSSRPCIARKGKGILQGLYQKLRTNTKAGDEVEGLFEKNSLSTMGTHRNVTSKEQIEDARGERNAERTAMKSRCEPRDALFTEREEHPENNRETY
ncbi:unnamed protein product [Arctogadus glacialis]